MKNNPELIDLHAHTTASDGSASPTELVDLAREAGLKAVAVTDHDTVSGVAEALARGRAVGVEVVPGVEISAEFKPGTMHILGYLLYHEHPGLKSQLAELQDARNTRNPKIVARLNALGFDITMAEIQAAAGGDQVGRPHFAQVMMDKGYVSTFNEAFDRYLTKGGPAYVDKFRFNPAGAMAAIRQAGGLPVLAHPHTLGLNDYELETLIAGLIKDGLAGIEVYYSEFTQAMSDFYVSLAAKYGLARTGGSDFHGAAKPEITLGRGLGNLRIPYALLEDLRQRRMKIS